MEIAATSISLSLNETRVLEGVDISVRTGEFVGLVGPNGAGKTSLLRVLAGLLPAKAGSVSYDGKDIAALKPRVRAQMVAYLAQNDGAHWPIRVEALAGLGRLPHRGRTSDEADRAVVKRALDLVGMADFAARGFDTLSGGEQARVLLARALAVEAPLLLADEPISALDPYHQLAIMELLREQTRAGNGVVAVLHDIGLAYRYCDRVVLLAKGKKLAEGRPEEVLSDENIATAYGIAVKRGEGYILPWQRETAR
ncbi:ABC transporter [Terrihabitans soli]|uniref:ABC transporter n=1 Tax=Terrihabitans soli TaxID=708113 RepID=A0A6S6QYB2_9HYPH|nr:ABC transporter ATP-binding protein [Terrihabitans soli]BCJ92262.1 ABC transporter [Terrihabitans soli]